MLALSSDSQVGDSEHDAAEGTSLMDAAEESGQSSKYLERSVLDTVAEGVTEGISDVVSSVKILKHRSYCGLFLITFLCNQFSYLSSMIDADCF